jgi:hypothetical protein
MVKSSKRRRRIKTKPNKTTWLRLSLAVMISRLAVMAKSLAVMVSLPKKHKIRMMQLNLTQVKIGDDN